MLSSVLQVCLAAPVFAAPVSQLYVAASVLNPGVKLLPCVGCSASKGYSAPVPKVTYTRSTLPAPPEGGEDHETAVGGMTLRTAMTTLK